MDKIRTAIQNYRATEARDREYVTGLLAEAERTNDYYEYDQASYDFYECMTAAAEVLIQDIEAALR